MRKIAIVVPTYNRSEDIELFINGTSFLMDYEDADLLIYDSSENENTKNVVFDYNAKQKEKSIIYHLVASETHPNEKFYNIYVELCGLYEYIWIIHDHTIFSEEAFRFIYDNLGQGPDFIYLKMHCPVGVTSCNIIVEGDKERFLYDSAWFLGKIGAALVKAGSFITGLDWRRYREKYLTKELINYSHVGLYFERLSEMKDPCIWTIEFPRGLFWDTRTYKTFSWNDDAVRICTECWGGVIASLPESYGNKDRVIRTIDEHVITKYRLLELKEKGLYSAHSYLKYRKWIKKTIPHMQTKAFVIAFSPVWFSSRIYMGGLMQKISRSMQRGIPVYIFGAGRHGYECLELLENKHIKCDGFVVTKIQGNPKQINDYSVKTVDEVLEKNKRNLFVLAVMDIYKKEILTFLEGKKSEGAEIELAVF